MHSRLLLHLVDILPRLFIRFIFCFIVTFVGIIGGIGDDRVHGAGDAEHSSKSLDDPEAVLRLLVKANENKDLATMEQYMGQDPQAIGYTIGGRKFVGWKDFSKVMQTEFHSVDRLTIPITSLQVWNRGEVAWFAMELDYTREVSTSQGATRTVIPLRETGVLERRNGQWQLVNWHESLQHPVGSQPQGMHSMASASQSLSKQTDTSLDLSGKWQIDEEDKSYYATLDANGNGPYTNEKGTFTTTEINGRLWTGTWVQKGNDREGGFEVLLSEDFSTAEGVWWYTRVGEHKNIPPRMHGGSYFFKRLNPDTMIHANQ